MEALLILNVQPAVWVSNFMKMTKGEMITELNKCNRKEHPKNCFCIDQQHLWRIERKFNKGAIW